jgi:hypothetical protein
MGSCGTHTVSVSVRGIARSIAVTQEKHATIIAQHASALWRNRIGSSAPDVMIGHTSNIFAQTSTPVIPGYHKHTE